MTHISNYISPYKHVYNYFKNITKTFNRLFFCWWPEFELGPCIYYVLSPGHSIMSHIIDICTNILIILLCRIIKYMI